MKDFLSEKMKKNNRHILHQVNLEINTSNEPQAYAIKANADSFLNENLLPKIESLFDNTDAQNEIKRFDSIDIEINIKSTDNFDEASEKIIEHLHEKIEALNLTSSKRSEKMYQDLIARTKNSGTGADDSKISEHHKMTSLDQASNLKSIFLHFLETGQLPWYGSSSLLTEFIESGSFISELGHKNFLESLKHQLLTNRNVVHRFIHQLDNQIIDQFILHLSEEANISTEKLQLKISGHNQSVKDLMYELIINKLINPEYLITKEKILQLQDEIFSRQRSQVLSKKISRQVLGILNAVNLDTSGFNFFENLTNSKTHAKQSVAGASGEFEMQNKYSNPEETSNELFAGRLPDVHDINRTEPEQTYSINENKQNENTDLKAVYIQNAGLILLHPFFWNFFTNTQCTDGKSGLLPEKTSLAIHLLHYLATGQEQEMEYKLTFEKFLCGVPLNSPVSRKIKFSDSEKKECNELLKSVIGYWTALKNTSPDGLRQMFLQRDGKLDLHEFPYRLFVERKAQDVLLEKLEWNISIVKLPWIKELLFVEW
ncbi:MAG: contractile injection system tape measure protein [Bacteroidota bacterium]|nr:hypothetical protein [Odoribacter sp.]MDP3644698.1 contractile injection system tape measure protein [Bacteroidota bacterium]